MATRVDTNHLCKNIKKKEVEETKNQLLTDAVMKEGRCEAAGDWSNRVRSVTRALTTGCMKRGTAPENGVYDLTQGRPEMLNTIKWEKYVLRHTQKTSEK